MNNLEELLEEAYGNVGPGWWPLVDKYLPQIVELAPDADFDIKEKYGTLRLRAYGNVCREAVELMDRAEEESASICEECGAPGQLYSESEWNQTLCKKCAQEWKQKPQRTFSSKLQNWIKNIQFEKTKKRRRKYREGLVSQALKHADGDPQRALEALQRDYKKVSMKEPEKLVAHVMAMSKLTDIIEKMQQ